MRGAAAKQTQNLLENAGSRRFGELVTVADHRVVNVGVDAEIESGRKLDGAQNADRIFTEANAGIADGANGAPLDVLHASAPIENLAAVEIVKERVDREIAADGVFMGVAEDVV